MYIRSNNGYHYKLLLNYLCFRRFILFTAHLMWIKVVIVKATASCLGKSENIFSFQN
jgi:hypothetical protein